MTGQSLSHYKILDKIGEGGMGVVYRAEDTKLDRAVALKFLPAHLLSNDDVRKRFQREAKSSAALSHPNVCTVHEIDEADGQTFIAMELIEGESLDRKIARGPLKLDEALSIAQQIAKGLESAHKRGIIHRDIKPENVMVGDDGHVTIMDFGLAQLTEASRLTRTDETVGTVAYMSPEQTEGSGTDHRTDTWSLGVVLYEMVTGQQPFKGDYDKAVMYSILNEEPVPITALRTGVPMGLEILVGKCLEKDPSKRYQSLMELAVDLSNVAEKGDIGLSKIVKSATRSVQLAPVQTAGWRQILPWVLAALSCLGWLLSRTGEIPQELPVSRFSFTPGHEIDTPVISPDGRRIAYVGIDDSDERTLWVRNLANEMPRILSGTEGAAEPFWSPDSRYVAFQTSSHLKKVELDGGAVTTLCELPHPRYRGGTWSPDGDTIVFSVDIPAQLFVVSALGGEAKLLLETSPRGGLSFPRFLPVASGTVLLIGEGGPGDRRSITYDIDTSVRRDLGPGIRAVYSPTGHIVYQTLAEGGQLRAVPFSIERLEIAGEPFPVAQEAHQASVARDGSLVYRDQPHMPPMRLIWRDRKGLKLERVTARESLGERLGEFSVSPQGDRIVCAIVNDEGADLWLFQVGSEAGERLTFEQGGDRAPIWSPDGEQLAFMTVRGGTRDIYLMTLSDGRVEPLVETDGYEWPSDWSPDGRYLLYRTLDSSGGDNIHYLDFDASGEATQLYLDTPFDETDCTFSPNGSYVACVSQRPEGEQVYVRRFPEGDQPLLISPNGGIRPRWRADGREMFYLERRTLVAVQIETTNGFAVTGRIHLFDLEVSSQYEVGPDGQRFFVFEQDLPEETLPPVIHIVQNWYEEFRDRERPKN